MWDSLSYLDNLLRKVIISVLWSTLMSNFNLRCQPKISARNEKKGQRNKCLKLLLKTGLPNIIFYWSTDQNDYFRCFAYILVSINIVAHNDSIQKNKENFGLQKGNGVKSVAKTAKTRFM